MPGPYREEKTYVGPYYRDGTRVPGHPSHALVRTPVFLVLFRKKDVRVSGGTRANPRNKLYKWHLKGRFRTEKAAENERRRLMAEGYHAIVEEVGGRAKMPSLHELLTDANREDRFQRQMRRE